MDYKVLRVAFVVVFPASLIRFKGVKSCRVALIAEKASVQFDPAVTSAETIVNAVTKLGYPSQLRSQQGDEGTQVIEFVLSEDNMQHLDRIETQAGVVKVTVESSNNVSVRFDVLETGPRTIISNCHEPKGVHLKQLGNSTNGGGTNNRAEQEYKKSFFGSLWFTIPVVFISMVLPMFDGASNFLTSTVVPGLQWEPLILCVLTTPVQFGYGFRFYKNAYHSMKNGAANMDVLVALGTTSAYLYSFVTIILSVSTVQSVAWQEAERDAHFFETSAMLISFVLLGKYLEAKARARTADAITALLSLQPQTAILIGSRDEFPVSKVEKQIGKAGGGSSPQLISDEDIAAGCDSEKEIDLRLIELGDVLKVYPGARIPCDGLILNGSSSVDESFITGEALPVNKSCGDQVLGGSVNSFVGSLYIRANRVGGETALAQIINLVEQAQTSKAPIQANADKIAKWFVPTVVLMAIITWVCWFCIVFAFKTPPHYLLHSGVTSRIVFAFKFGVAVLVISCPCALG